MFFFINRNITASHMLSMTQWYVDETCAQVVITQNVMFISRFGGKC